MRAISRNHSKGMNSKIEREGMIENQVATNVKSTPLKLIRQSNVTPMLSAYAPVRSV